MSQIANGAIINWGGDSGTAVTSARNLAFTINGAVIDVTGLADALKYYAVGLPDVEVSFDQVGVGTIELGDTAEITVVWSGGTAQLTGVLFGCYDASQKGDVDGAIITTYKFKPVRA